MKKKFTILMFSLLLAVGWTTVAHAQALPAESATGQFTKFDKPKVVLAESLEYLGIHSHSNSSDLSAQDAPAVSSIKAISKINRSTEKTATKKVHGTRANAPMRADLEMKSLTKDEADALIYWWDNGDGNGPRPSKSSEVAKDPVQMYSLLRYVYMTPDFPGPYYSAYTKTNEREREVYYGGIDGGWNIPGVAASAAPVAGTQLVANGTTTNSNVPVASYYQDYGYRSQMIYPASLLTNLAAGDQITSITFYPSAGLSTSGSTITFQLCNTTETNFGTGSSSNTSRKTVSGAVSATITPTTNNSATEWTITFSSPLTYTGGNLLLDVYCVGYNHDGTSGSYAYTNFYGQNQSSYLSMYVRGTSTETPAATKTGTNTQFLPKTTFNYTRGGGNVVKQLGDLIINDNGTENNPTYGLISSIVVRSGNTIIASWDYPTNGTTLSFAFVNDNNPPSLYSLNNTSYLCFNGNGIMIPESWLTEYNDVHVEIKAYRYSNSYNPIIYVNNEGKSVTSTDYTSPTTLTWDIEGTTIVNTAIPDYLTDTYKPSDEGYTALLLAVKDDATQTDYAHYDSNYDNGFHSDSTMIVEYLANNVDSIILLTDGLRIGSGMEAGTVFNCTGTYNKFFFLGKGQARQKPDIVKRREILYQHLLGEYVPFRYMYEQFSPTSGQSGSQTSDFYSRMMDGHVYNVVHDCRSVIHLGHQFSMSGNEGTTPYAMTGLNFFIPDYRLKYWSDEFTVEYVDGTTDGPYNIDGRIMNPYQSESTDGNPAFNPALQFIYASNIASWYAQYNQQYAPKVGLYKITLEANAKPITDQEHMYNVTLDWTSSLNELASSEVPQTYYLYYVTVDEQGNETIADEPFAVVENSTTYTYPREQNETSYTLYYIIKGSPEDDEHSKFIAWSNDAHVVIPGYNDFMVLEREHFESDFVVGNIDRGEKNYYRNFLLLANANDDNALTTDRIELGKNEFVLQRYNYDDPQKVTTDVATVHLSLANGGKYVNAIIDYDETNEDIYEPEGNTTKYYRSTMHMQETTQDVGTLSVTGNGDIVITPNGFEVNFMAITVTADGTTTTWTPASGNLPNGWHLSPSTWWTEYEGAYYLDGGGYIYIPTNGDTNATVKITAFGDGTSLAKVDVNGTSKAFANGSNNAQTKSWTVNTTGSSRSRAPRQASDRATNTVTFTAGTDAGNNSTTTGGTPGADKIGKLNVGVKSTSAALNANPYRFYAGSITISARDGGRITNVVINGTSNNYPVSRISGSGYSYSGNTGTWSGNSPTVTLNVSSQVRVSSIVVTHVSDDPVDPAEGTIIWDFEEESDFNDFNIIDSDGDSYNWEWSHSGSISHSGTGVVQSASYDNNVGELTPDNWMISPEVTLGGTLTLWACGQDDDWASEKFGVFVCVGSYNGVSSFVQVGPTVTTNGIMTQYTFDLSQFQGQGHFAIRHFNVTNEFYLNIDDIMITGQGGGDTPEPEATGMVRMRLPILDEFSASTADNDHPRRYVYVLKYAPNTADEESTNTVEVPVQHTGAVVKGFYTLDEINNDTDRGLMVNVLNAEIDMELANLQSPYFYTINRRTNARPDVETGNRAVLQRRDDNWYQEMRDSSPRFGQEYAPGSIYEGLDTEGIVGGEEVSYNEYMSYVPIVWTKGFDRRYYDEDEINNPNTAHNSYGAPVYKTGAGEVIVLQHSITAERQLGTLGSTSWKDASDQDCSLYMLTVDQVTGKLPTMSTVKYEPYMFRVFVESDHGALRGYTWDGTPATNEDTPGSPGAHLENDDSFTNFNGPWCVWSQRVYPNQYENGQFEFDFTKLKDNDNWANNIMFGALDAISKDMETGQEKIAIDPLDLKVYVRFYYVVQGFNTMPSGMRDGDEPGGPAGYGAEGGGNPDPSTAVREIFGFADILDVTYVNAQGMTSDKPFDGINVVITRYTDGTTRTTKVVR